RVVAGNLTFGIRIALNAENSSHARAEARPADRRRRAIEIAPDVREKYLAVAVGLAPAGLVGLIFVVIPLAISLYVSLWEWPLLRPGREFLGLGNYARLLQTPDFWHALRVTLLYAAGVVGLGTPLALLLALALHQVRRGQTLYRTAIFLPVAITTVVAAIFWRWLYQPYAGPLALLWQVLGWRPIAWLNDVALPALILMALWKQTGYYVLVYLAGLTALPAEVHEAARLDGAGWLAETWYVTLPLLRPITAFVLITGSIFALESFGPVYVLTGGGPAGATTTLVLYLYERAFAFSELGYAAALGWALFVLLIPLIWLQFRLWGRAEVAA
ncbi:MAG: sugar ABC transporter permease, partial [Anaerolineae bacterium]